MLTDSTYERREEMGIVIGSAHWCVNGFECPDVTEPGARTRGKEGKEEPIRARLFSFLS